MHCCRCSSLGPRQAATNPHPSQPQTLWMEAHSIPSPPGFSPLCLALCYDPGFPSTRAHFLTSAEGNASCLATLILFSWWSALISLPQLVSGPESKWTEKGKWFRTILGSYDMLNQCFFPCDRRYLKNDIEHACQDCGCLPHSAARCSTRHLHTD